MTVEQKSLVVVDDHAIFRMGVAQALASSGDLKIIGEGTSCEDAVRLATELNPDIVLVDISMPGGGLKAAAEIRSASPDAHVVVLTVSEEEHDVLQALDAGVSGYILKGISGEQLVEILTSIASGQTYVSPTLGIRVLSAIRTSAEADRTRELLLSLSPKERLTLRLICEGLSNREIATAMGVQVKTVKFHVTNLLQKLSLRNRVEAALFAQKHMGAGIH